MIFLQCSNINAHSSMNGQWLIVNDNLLEIDNSNLIIASKGGL